MTMAPKSYKGIAGLLLKTQWCNDKVSGWYTAHLKKKLSSMIQGNVCILPDDLLDREIQTILINLFQVGVSFPSMLTLVSPWFLTIWKADEVVTHIFLTPLKPGEKQEVSKGIGRENTR